MFFTIFFYIFLATAFVSFLVSFMAWKRKQVKGAIELCRLMFSAGFYAFFIAFEASSTSMEEKVMWSKIGYYGAASVPVFYFIFIKRYTGSANVTSQKNMLLLFTLPVITLILAITNEKHHLLWSSYSPINPETNLAVYHHGIWFWIGYMAYDYILLFFATISLFRFIFGHKHVFRKQGFLILFAGICPWIAGIIYLTNLNPVSGFDLAPVFTGLSGILLIYVIQKQDFLDLVPIARKTLVETLQDGILALDSKNRIQDINEAAYLYLGIKVKNVLGLSIDSPDVTQSPMLDAVVALESYDQFEITDDQGLKTFSIIKQEIKNEIGSRLVVIRDISDIMAKQKEIQAGEERYRNMYRIFRLMSDNMSDMLWAKDLDKKFIFVNKAVCDDLLLASDTNEPIGKADLFFKEREQKKHPDSPEWHNIAMNCIDSDETVLRTKKSEHFDEFGYVKGEFRYFDVQKAPIFNEKGEMIGVVGSSRDVTLQKMIEKDISERDKLLNAITKATAQLIQGENLEESIYKSLEIIGKATGLNRIYIISNSFSSEMQKPSISMAYEWVDDFAKDLEVVRGVKNAYFRQTMFDWFGQLSQGQIVKGKTRDFDPAARTFLESQNVKSILIAPVFVEKNFWGTIGFEDCQSERSWTFTEEQLLTTAAGTIVSVYVRKKNQEELILAKERAEESDRLKSAFLANLSHEIRTPMNSILGFITLLQDPNLTKEEKEEFAKIVKQGGERLLNTMHDIIDISKIEARQMKISYQDVNIDDLFEKLYEIFHPEVVAKDLTFIKPEKVGHDLAWIKTDKDKINSILTNLIKNAIKYTHTGSIEMGCERKSWSYLFYVRDTGIGISPDKCQTIFNRFVQADVSNTRLYEGSGLGLSLSKAYVEMLGGKIWVESKPDIGSIFYFRIPLSYTEDLDCDGCPPFAEQAKYIIEP